MVNIIIAARFPIGNDEAYYIAFAKDMQLSYVDAPPFVAYLNIIQAHFGLVQPLANRLGVIILHLSATIFLMLIVKNNLQTKAGNISSTNVLADKLLLTFLLAYIVPIFGLYGILILPDSGLILGLSIMLWATDASIRQQRVSLKNSICLGVGLGLGLLSKYHILPLGGGMLLGLYLDLVFIRKQVNLINLSKLLLSIIIGLIIAAPVFIWNYANNYASFVFQLQHGFNSEHWQLSSMLGFIMGALLYLTPWFFYMLGKYGLLSFKRYFLLIPVFSLSLILLISSLRKNILPHWLAPALWLLIPYTVINLKQLTLIKSMCKYTSILWLILLLILLLPGGILNIKTISKQFNPDTTGLADLLLWQELPGLFAGNVLLQQSLTTLDLPANCPKLIGTTRWYWAAQLEYHNVFGPHYKILNLDLNSSNFYTWRDKLANYANCPIVVIADRNNYAATSQLVNVKNSYFIKGLGDYKSLNLTIIEGNFKDAATLTTLQNNLLTHPHY